MLMQPLKTLFFLSFITLILCVNGYSQTPVKNYQDQWKKVDELISKKNLPKSALTEVKKIYELAKKERQEAQIIKALIYMISLQRETRENNEALTIREIENEIKAQKEPVVSILRSLEAEVYQQYFNNTRWKIYDRTETDPFAGGFKKGDLSTWSASDFFKKISDLYLQSVK